LLFPGATVVYHWDGRWGQAQVASQLFHIGPGIRPAFNDMIGGAAASVLTVTFGLSYALLILQGP